MVMPFEYVNALVIRNKGQCLSSENGKGGHDLLIWVLIHVYYH
jgi:hypothetical protein